MSPALIRCLLAVLALSQSYEHVASKDVAHLLGVKRPTVHRTLGVLQEAGFVEKEPYGDIRLTESGAKRAIELENGRDDLTLLFSGRFGLAPDESAKAALLLLGELSEESVRRLRCAGA